MDLCKVLIREFLKRYRSPANNKILAHLVLPWRAAFINGVKPDAFLASTSISGHLWRRIFRQSAWPESKKGARSSGSIGVLRGLERPRISSNVTFDCVLARSVVGRASPQTTRVSSTQVRRLFLAAVTRRDRSSGIARVKFDFALTSSDRYRFLATREARCLRAHASHVAAFFQL